MSESKGPGRQGRPWRRAQALCIDTARKLGLPCYLCALPIHWDATPCSRMAPSAHHHPPLGWLLACGLDPNDQQYLFATHVTCNSRQGNRVDQGQHDGTSRQW